MKVRRSFGCNVEGEEGRGLQEVGGAEGVVGLAGASLGKE